MILKTSFVIVFFISIFLFSCTKTVTVTETPVQEVPISDLGKYKMKILPESPASNDEIRLVIYEDCKYNRLTGVQRSGTTIDIEKQYNSMIMAPCFMTNDTILIGKLPVNTYKVNYRLVDIAVPPGRTTFGISFKLAVGN